ncbi:MAG: site-specific integrase [Gammaproteobacteria bacterium]
MPTITKNSAGNWKAVIRKTGWPIAIKTFRAKRDASDWARRVEDEMVRGVYIDRAPSERLTLRAAMNRYLSEISPTKRKGAAEREKTSAKPILEALGDYSLAAVTQQLIADYRDQRLGIRSLRTGGLLSTNTVRLELALLSHLFTVAIQEWGIGLGHNPVAMVRKPKPPNGRDRRISPKEQDPLLTECAQHSNPMLYWIVVLAIETGMRRGEIVGLRRGQVDPQRRIIRLPDTKNGSARSVPLTKRAVQVLVEALDHPIRPIDTDLVFWGDTRDRATGERKPYDFTEAWESARTRARVPDLKFHDLRHEAVSRLVEAGLSDQEVAAISGHKSMQMLKRYTHLRAEDLVTKLDRAFQNP